MKKIEEVKSMQWTITLGLTASLESCWICSIESVLPSLVALKRASCSSVALSQRLPLKAPMFTCLFQNLQASLFPTKNAFLITHFSKTAQLFINIGSNIQLSAGYRLDIRIATAAWPLVPAPAPWRRRSPQRPRARACAGRRWRPSWTVHNTGTTWIGWTKTWKEDLIENTDEKKSVIEL